MTVMAVVRPAVTRDALRQLVPSVVATAARREDDPWLRLDPREELYIASAVPERRAEFRTVRECAKDALAQLGASRPCQIPGLHGEPSWPDGVVGSMTHCRRYRAAAVALNTRVAALGIDAEPHEALPPGLISDIAIPRERKELARLSGRYPEVQWSRLLFSAKESVYKAWFPIQRSWLGFEDVEVRFVRGRKFIATFLGDPLVLAHTVFTTMVGEWAVDRGTLVTAVCVNCG